ncbi:MAG: GtrA family protein [Acidimicrobiia bacterium]|nr:GtrA family protein [Acidimicrobiia bacterium]
MERRSLFQRLTRCMSVSVLTTVISLTILTICTAGLGLVAWAANVAATAVATVPGYHVNRRWTWGRRDPSDPWREVLPFWVLAFTGLVLSTLAVGVVDSWASGAHLESSTRTAAVLGAHLSGFGALWVVQFILLDRFLFARRVAHVPAESVALTRS